MQQGDRNSARQKFVPEIRTDLVYSSLGCPISVVATRAVIFDRAKPARDDDDLGALPQIVKKRFGDP